MNYTLTIYLCIKRGACLQEEGYVAIGWLYEDVQIVSERKQLISRLNPLLQQRYRGVQGSNLQQSSCCKEDLSVQDSIKCTALTHAKFERYDDASPP